MKPFSPIEFDLIMDGVPGAQELREKAHVGLDGWLFFDDSVLEGLSTTMKILLGVK